MIILHNGRKIAKVLKTSVSFIVMYEYKTLFYDSWNEAIQELQLHGYSF